MASPLENLETKLETLIENVRQIKIIVSDFQPQDVSPKTRKKLLYFIRLLFRQTIVTDLQEIDRLKSQVQDVHVPLEVFDYIDDGRNPQLYTKDCMEKALSRNEEVRGKIDAYRRFRAQLLVELTSVFPAEIGKYRTIRGDERPTS